MARALAGIGITSPQQLVSQDPLALFERLCRRTGVRHDPCVLDVFIAITRFMAGESPRVWWAYTPERKRLQGARLQRPED